MLALSLVLVLTTAAAGDLSPGELIGRAFDHPTAWSAMRRHGPWKSRA